MRDSTINALNFQYIDILHVRSNTTRELTLPFRQFLGTTNDTADLANGQYRAVANGALGGRIMP